MRRLQQPLAPSDPLSGNSAAHSEPAEDGDVCGGERGWPTLTRAQEYSNLLAFVAQEAQKAKRGGGADGDDGGLTKRRTRLWYAPWKVKEETIDKNGEVVTTKRDVPQEWLETDMTRGLSESDINTRRSEFGYNELESAHENMCVGNAVYRR